LRQIGGEFFERVISAGSDAQTATLASQLAGQFPTYARRRTNDDG
jgi:hypothetical protein